MTPERAFLARVFVDHCVTTKDDRRLESVLPVVTALAFRIQTAYNHLVEEIEAEEQEMLLRGDIGDDEENELRAEREEARLDQEFIIGEMLRMSVNLDYADEIGRRKMFQLVRKCSDSLHLVSANVTTGDMLSQDVLPESLVSRCLDVLRMLSPNERDLIRVVVEVIHTLRDPLEEPAVSVIVNVSCLFVSVDISIRSRSRVLAQMTARRPSRIHQRPFAPRAPLRNQWMRCRLKIVPARTPSTCAACRSALACSSV